MNFLDGIYKMRYYFYSSMQICEICIGTLKREVAVDLRTRAECVKKYGSDYYIQRKVESGELFRVEKGIYSEQKTVPELALLSYKYPKAVITMDTAFYLYGLTDEIPETCTMATKREAAPIPDRRVKQYFVPRELLDMGTTTIDYKGYTITIYDRERMLVELIRYKNKLPYDYYKEILGNYRRIVSQLNVELISNYAAAMPWKDKVIRTLRAEVF